MKLETELMRGAGPSAVLQLLADGEKYGYQLVEALTKRSKGVLQMGQSTLYPMLYNLEAKGLVISSNKPGPNGRLRRYYRLTPAGVTRLEKDRAQWAALVEGLQALGLAPNQRELVFAC
ncbi:MAG TPA: PadR family transcriptional regulator [Pirellulaceae bacterium]|nr:PadR family transcriptional regulator [Pirellulaceae bacterium]HMO91319.1 PadR family transcriptional regulator [Pirellulaceae bacterium]HMP70138.1 PadR family transcriptional regulator [Pirellulaceae bacterium]